MRSQYLNANESAEPQALLTEAVGEIDALAFGFLNTSTLQWAKTT